jgi:glycosyltransferase involved in cell wall biosynthesis
VLNRYVPWVAAAGGPSIVQVFYRMQDRGGEMVASTLTTGFQRAGLDVRDIGFFRGAPASTNSPTRHFEVLCDRPPRARDLGRAVVALARRVRAQRPAGVVLHTDIAAILGGVTAMLSGAPRRVVVHHLPVGTQHRWLRPVHALLGTIGVYTDVVFVNRGAYADTDSFPARYRARRHLILNATTTTDAPSRADARRALGLPETKRIVLAVGSLCEQKNHATLIDAMADVDDATLIIAGDGELRDDLEKRAASRGTDVRLLGAIDPEDVHLWLGACDVFAFPSLFEGRSPALLEAAALAPSIVASDIPENVEVLENRAAYCAPTDRQAWSSALGRALDEPAVDTRGERDMWSADDMIDSYLAILVPERTPR